MTKAGARRAKLDRLATSALRSFSTLAAGLGRQIAILRKAALFIGYAFSTLAGDFALFFAVH